MGVKHIAHKAALPGLAGYENWRQDQGMGPVATWVPRPWSTWFSATGRQARVVVIQSCLPRRLLVLLALSLVQPLPVLSQSVWAVGQIQPTKSPMTWSWPRAQSAFDTPALLEPNYGNDFDHWKGSEQLSSVEQRELRRGRYKKDVIMIHKTNVPVKSLVLLSSKFRIFCF